MRVCPSLRLPTALVHGYVASWTQTAAGSGAVCLLRRPITTALHVTTDEFRWPDNATAVPATQVGTRVTDAPV